MNSSLGAILTSATSGMRAAQVGLDMVSRNIANASVEGYTRKDAPLETRIVAFGAQGVVTGEIRRSVSQSLLQDMRGGAAIAEAMRVKEDFLAQLELQFGAPGDGASIVSRLGALADGFRALVAEPDSATLQQQALLRADAFAASARSLSDSIQGLRLEAERRIDATVQEINLDLARVQTLNRAIVQGRGLAQSTADMEDQRDTLLARLATRIDIKTRENASGEMQILTRAGDALLFGDADKLSFNANAAISPSMTREGGALSGIELDGTDISARIDGGRLRGLLDVRDDTMVRAQAQLDELVARVAQNFALADLDLFRFGTAETVLDGRAAAGPAAAGTTAISIGDPTGIATGMNLRFANHAETYVVTAIAGDTLTLARAAPTGTGLAVDIPSGTRLVLAAQPGTASIGFARLVDIDPDLSANPWRLRDGTSAATIGSLAQANAIPRAVIDSFERIQPFSTAAGLRSGLTFTGYATALVAGQATERANLADTLEARDALNQQLRTRFNSDSGVNMDNELALMIEIQTSYAASAKIVQATRQMFDDLLSTLR